jgi:DNA-binding FadR family transcriptional regulator
MPSVRRERTAHSDGLSSLKSTRARNLKTSEIVARELVAYIVDEDLPEGTALPPERVMVESLNVGRTTLREALRLLETRGVITIRSGPGGGPIVRRPRPEDLSEALSLILQFEAATFRQVMDARMWLEPALARLAAERIDDAGIAQLEAANVEIARSQGNLDAFSDGNSRFHSIVAEHSGNIVLQIFAATLHAIGDGRSVGITYSKRHTAAIAEAHTGIIAALRAHDADGAEGAMREHLDEANTYWRRRFADRVSQPVRWTD